MGKHLLGPAYGKWCEDVVFAHRCRTAPELSVIEAMVGLFFSSITLALALAVQLFRAVRQVLAAEWGRGAAVHTDCPPVPWALGHPAIDRVHTRLFDTLFRVRELIRSKQLANHPSNNALQGPPPHPRGLSRLLPWWRRTTHYPFKARLQSPRTRQLELRGCFYRAGPV